MGGLGSLWAFLLFARHGFAVGVLIVCSPWVCSLLVCYGFARHGPWVLSVGLGLACHGFGFSSQWWSLWVVVCLFVYYYYFFFGVEC